LAHDKHTTTNTPSLIAWHVAERGEKKFWTRLGAAWNQAAAKIG
jgi:hypothetical protein